MRMWLAQLAHDVIVMLGGQLERLRRTPRYDSPRKLDQAHLWALRKGRRLWRRRRGAAERYRAELKLKTVHLQLSRWVDGEFVDGEVQTFLVDSDSLAIHQDVVACTFDGEIFAKRYTSLLRIFSEDPRLLGYKAGMRPQDPPAHDWPTGAPDIPYELRGIADARAAEVAAKRRKYMPMTTAKPRGDVL